MCSVVTDRRLRSGREKSMETSKPEQVKVDWNVEFVVVDGQTTGDLKLWRWSWWWDQQIEAANGYSGET